VLENDLVSAGSLLIILFFLQLSLWPYLRKSCGSLAFPAAFSASVLLFTLISWYCGLLRLPISLALLPNGLLLAYAVYRREYTPDRLRAEWRWVLLFLVAFLAMAEVRYVNSSVSYAEKFMDHGFIASVMRDPVVPPLDPWFSGGYQNVYYYLGYWMSGALGIVSGVPSGVMFNLALPTVFGLSAVTMYALGHLLAPRFRWLPLAGFFLANPSFIAAVFSGKSLGSAFWDSTRTIAYTINEYPLFSLTWGDVHPHLVGMFDQIFLVFLLALSWRSWGALSRKGRALLIGLIALSLGSMPAINSWDVLLYAPLTVIAGLLVWHRYRTSGTGGLVRRFQAFIRSGPARIREALRSPLSLPDKPWAILVVAPVIAVLLYLPFYFQIGTQGIEGIGLVVTPSDPVQFLLVYGFFIALILALLAGEVMRRPYLLLIGVPFAIAGYAAAAIAVIPLAYLLIRRKSCAEMVAAAGLGIIILCEFFYLMDRMGETFFRMNTVFKFGFAAWLLLSAGSLSMAARWLSRVIPAGRPSRRITALAWAVAVCLLLAAPFVVPLEPPYRSASLDGLAYLQEARPDDAAAVTYLREVPGNVTVVEAVGADYTYSSPISSFSGIPTIVGWPFHEYMWRGDRGGWYGERIRDVQTIYEDPLQIVPLMRKYNATYLYLGDLERSKYRVNLSGAPLREVFRSGNATIYTPS
jgi:YYY domain-containing protein